jgi:plastocyanin
MGRHRGRVMLVVGIVLVATACSSSNGGSGGGGSTGGGATGTSAAPAGGASASIVAQGFAFDPNSVSVSAGKVTLTVTNKDSTEHTFTLDDGSSSTSLDPGTTVTIDLDLSKTVGWHCSIHPSMTGTLEVG